MRRLLLLVSLLVLGCAGVSHAASRRHAPRVRTVPQGFLGVMADGPLFGPEALANPLQIPSEFTSMVRTGVESVRFVMQWTKIQPYPDMASVPAGETGRFHLVDGIPTDFSSIDQIVALSAARGLSMLPVVLTAPPWARKNPDLYYSPPADPAAFGRFVGVLARRYGPGGSFWRENPSLPRLPVRAWQIWNEPAGGATPDGSSFNWADSEPFQARYVAMLRASRAQIRAFDPQGQVVLAGMFGASWLSVAAVYAAGGRGLFDAVALNIFTRRVADVLDNIRRVRAVIIARHDNRRLPIMLTELTWPSSLGQVAPPNNRDYEVTPRVQALRVTSAIRNLVAQRKLLGISKVFWYTWITPDGGIPDPFVWAGLRAFGRPSFVAKPAQAAYAASALKYEGCRKLVSALRCGR